MIDTDTGQPNEVDQVVKDMADRAEKNLPSVYNKLADEALALGLTGIKHVNRFANSETGEKRINDLRASIKAFKSGDSAERRTKRESATMKTSAKRKPAAKAKGKATKATTTRRAIKSDSARTPRDGIVGVFGTRAETNREKLLLKLSSPLGKKNNILDVCKAVYGNQSDTSQASLVNVVGGLSAMIENGKLPYTLTREGRGDEATLTLVKGKK